MTKSYLTKKKGITIFAVLIVVCILLIGIGSFETGTNGSSSFLEAVFAGIIGVTLVLTPIFIWLGVILGIFGLGIFLILWSFKVNRPKTQTEEHTSRMDARYKKYSVVAGLIGFTLIGLLIYYFIR